MFGMRYDLEDVRQRAASLRQVQAQLSQLLQSLEHDKRAETQLHFVRLSLQLAEELADVLEYNVGVEDFRRLMKRPVGRPRTRAKTGATERKRRGPQRLYTDEFLIHIATEVERARQDLIAKGTKPERVTDKEALTVVVQKNVPAPIAQHRLRRMVNNVAKRLPEAKRLKEQRKSIREIRS